MISDAALTRLRRRAHVHTERCWGRGAECVEHHAHDALCISKTLVCRQAEDVDLVALLAAYDAELMAKKAAGGHTCGVLGPCAGCR